MRPKLSVRVRGFVTLPELEGAWSDDDFRALLEEMDFGDAGGVASAELRELVVLSLQDRAPEEAAERLMRHRLGGRLKPGHLVNLAHELPDEKLWEHHADMSLHEELFVVGSLAHEAFPQVFHTPDAARVTLEVAPLNAAGREALSGAPSAAMIVRLLADGMPASAILRRLFDDALAGGPFPEADSIVWTHRVEPTSDGGVVIEVTSSGYWLDPIADADAYESSARPDDPPEA